MNFIKKLLIIALLLVANHQHALHLSPQAVAKLKVYIASNSLEVVKESNSESEKQKEYLNALSDLSKRLKNQQSELPVYIS